MRLKLKLKLKLLGASDAAVVTRGSNCPANTPLLHLSQAMECSD